MIEKANAWRTRRFTVLSYLTDGNSGAQRGFLGLESVHLLVEWLVLWALALDHTSLVDQGEPKVQMCVQINGEIRGIERRVVWAISNSLRKWDGGLAMKVLSN